jgi:hypothetical protein
VKSPRDGKLVLKKIYILCPEKKLKALSRRQGDPVVIFFFKFIISVRGGGGGPKKPHNHASGTGKLTDCCIELRANLFCREVAEFLRESI